MGRGTRESERERRINGRRYHGREERLVRRQPRLGTLNYQNNFFYSFNFKRKLIFRIVSREKVQLSCALPTGWKFSK